MSPDRDRGTCFVTAIVMRRAGGCVAARWVLGRPSVEEPRQPEMFRSKMLQLSLHASFSEEGSPPDSRMMQCQLFVLHSVSNLRLQSRSSTRIARETLFTTWKPKQTCTPRPGPGLTMS